MSLDDKIRAAVFTWLDQQTILYGEILPREVLLRGVVVQNLRIPLISAQKGIFKPTILPEYPLSILTSPKSPYGDSFSSDGLLKYRYRGNDPNHPDNVGLVKAMHDRIPLAYFHGVAPNKYLAAWPVYIIYANPGNLTFTVAVDDNVTITIQPGTEPSQRPIEQEDPFSRRKYITTLVKKRLHQQVFRLRVMRAYHEQCAFCNLRHKELIDAAHIVRDSEPEGEPDITNGIALCKLHHASFDSFFVGINPDYRIEVRKDILEEADGPMLLHGLQGLHEQKIARPHLIRWWPDKTLLEKKYSQFLMMG